MRDVGERPRALVHVERVIVPPIQGFRPAAIAGVAAVAAVYPAGDKVVDGEAVAPAQVGHRQPHVRRLERAGMPVGDRDVDPADGDDRSALARRGRVRRRCVRRPRGCRRSSPARRSPGVADDRRPGRGVSRAAASLPADPLTTISPPVIPREAPGAAAPSRSPALPRREAPRRPSPRRRRAAHCRARPPRRRSCRRRRGRPRRRR